MTAERQVLHGRDEIERAHVRWIAQDAARGGSTHVHPPETVHIQFLRRDLAVVDVECQFDAHQGESGGEAPRERAATFMVVTKEAGEWRVAEVRNAARPLF